MSRSCLPNFEAAIISCPRCWSASTHPAATVAAGLNARTAPVGEHRRRAPAQRTAEKHGEDGAVAQPLACLRCAARSGAPAPAGGWVSCRTRRRFDFALFPRAVPAASSGASRPSSVVATDTGGWGCAPRGGRPQPYSCAPCARPTASPPPGTAT